MNRAAIEQPYTFDARGLRLTSGIDLNGLGLEIGPSHAPTLPKRAGYNVETLDHCSADELRKHYTALSHPIDKIEDVDYVTGGRSMLETIKSTGRFDYIIASHVIEHIPSLLGFLQECQALLKPTGVLSLAAPDKRFCFDVLQPLSTTGHALQAALDPPHRPSAAALFDFQANFARRNGADTWAEDDASEVTLVNTVTHAKACFDAYVKSDAYADIHAWRFVPSSFRLIVKDLNTLGLINLHEVELDTPGGVEFFVKLSQAGTPIKETRAELAIAALREHARILTSPPSSQPS
jgi:SAM-dependent methyltransferase